MTTAKFSFTNLHTLTPKVLIPITLHAPLCRKGLWVWDYHHKRKQDGAIKTIRLRQNTLPHRTCY